MDFVEELVHFADMLTALCEGGCTHMRVHVPAALRMQEAEDVKAPYYGLWSNRLWLALIDREHASASWEKEAYRRFDAEWARVSPRLWVAALAPTAACTPSMLTPSELLYRRTFETVMDIVSGLVAKALCDLGEDEADDSDEEEEEEEDTEDDSNEEEEEEAAAENGGKSERSKRSKRSKRSRRARSGRSGRSRRSGPSRSESESDGTRSDRTTRRGVDIKLPSIVEKILMRWAAPITIEGHVVGGLFSASLVQRWPHLIDVVLPLIAPVSHLPEGSTLRSTFFNGCIQVADTAAAPPPGGGDDDADLWWTKGKAAAVAADAVMS